MKNQIKNLVTLSVLFGIIVMTISCNKYSFTPLYNTDCPFRQLNFTTSNEKDSLLNTVAINDTLVANLKLDLKALKEGGTVGNNLNVAINKMKSASSDRKLDVTNEYFQLFNNKTTAICGLNNLLKNNKRLRSPANREKAENLLISLIEDLSSFGDKKKEILNPN